MLNALLCSRRAASRTLNRRRIPLAFFNRQYTTDEKVNITHSQFLAEASPKAKWDKNAPNGDAAELKLNGQKDELEGVTDARGKLWPTSSHLLKLILPLGRLSHPSSKFTDPEDMSNSSKKPPRTPPTVILLHPSQPLSHVSRLILASLAPATPDVSFRSVSSGGKAFQWSDSTDVGDFIRDAARATEFTICFSYTADEEQRRVLPSANQGDARVVPVNEHGHKDGITETFLTVEVPTFADRTRFLRRRLDLVESRLQKMDGLKRLCDREAHRGARRMATMGFGMLVVYWGVVARLTFWDYGWEIMEPITYLSGLSTIILSYLYFLYQGREVSYSSVLARSISTRQEALYKSRGFDIDRWMEFMGEKKALRAEIGRIARDYDGDKVNKDVDVEDEFQKDDSASERDDEDVIEDDADELEKRGKELQKHGLSSGSSVHSPAGSGSGELVQSTGKKPKPESIVIRRTLSMSVTKHIARKMEEKEH